MKEMEVENKQTGQRVAILQNMDLLVRSTKQFSTLIEAAERNSVISKLEKNTILQRFGEVEDQLTAFYLLLNSKVCSLGKVWSLLNSTGNESAASVLHERGSSSEGSNSKTEEGTERNEWARLQKIITNNIDKLSSHTMNLGLVLCFASGVGLISGKDREMIANCSTLEIHQLKCFYETVSKKEEDALEKLLKVLKMTSNNWALDDLEINE